MADETFITDTACGDPFFKEVEETPAGVKGSPGTSAYEIYLANGGTVTEIEFNNFITAIAEDSPIYNVIESLTITEAGLIEYVANTHQTKAGVLEDGTPAPSISYNMRPGDSDDFPYVKSITYSSGSEELTITTQDMNTTGGVLIVGNPVVTTIDLSGLNAGGGGGTAVTPWELTAETVGASHTYRVSSTGSSIMDETNGSAIDLSGAGLDADVAITATRYIYLQAAVSGTTLTSWTLTASATDDPEVGLTTVAPIVQEYIRLRIGKVEIADGVATAIQYADDCKVIGSLFINGVIALGFTSEPFTE